MTGDHRLAFVPALAEDSPNRVGQWRVTERWEIVERHAGEIHQLAPWLDR